MAELERLTKKLVANPTICIGGDKVDAAYKFALRNRMGRLDFILAPKSVE